MEYIKLIIEISAHAHVYTTPYRVAPSYSFDRRLEIVDITFPLLVIPLRIKL